MSRYNAFDFRRLDGRDLNFLKPMPKLFKTLLVPILGPAFLFLPIFSAWAQDFNATGTTNIDLGTIAIIPTRAAISMDRVAENFSIYTQKDIETTPARNLGEFLSFIPGVDIKVTNGFGQPADISIQGSDARYVLLMVDGIPFNTQLSGQANPTIIPLENVDRIEVIRGASSSAWGSALGGVINVVTKNVGDSQIPHGSLTKTFAEFHTDKEAMDLSGEMLGVGYYFFGEHMESDGVRQFSDDNESKFFGKLGHALGDEAKLEGSFGYTGQKVHDGVLYGLLTTSTPQTARYGQLKLDINKPEFNFNLAGKYNDQDLRTDFFSCQQWGSDIFHYQ